MNSSTPLLNAAKVVSAATGLSIAALGFLGGIYYVVQTLFFNSGATLDVAVTSVAFTILGVGLGGALAWQSGRSLFGHVSAAVRFSKIGRLFLLYILVLALGQAIIFFDLLPVLTFPLLHILAATIPPFAILGYVSQALKAADIGWREMIVQVSSGAFLSTTAALFIEIVAGMMILIVALILAALTPDGRVYVEELSANLQNPVWLQNPENLQELLLFPPVSITIALVFIFLAPLAEEAVKLLGVVLMSYRRPSRAQAFMWGLACGAGFTIVENLFNTVLALEVWIFIMLLRIGGTAMHCLGTGLIAMGWQHFLTERRPWPLFGIYTLSVMIHAVWNGAVIGMAGISTLAIGLTSNLGLSLIGIAIAALLLLLLVLTTALIVATVVITKRLQTQLPAL